MNLDNPYAKEKRKILLEEGDNLSIEDKKKINDLEIKSREFIDEKLEELNIRVDSTYQKISDVKVEYQSRRQQYKALIALYRDCMRLAKLCSDLKKEMRQEK